MSNDAVAYVWRYSPFKGNTFNVHHAIADTVNDMHGQKFWLSQEGLAKKTRSSVRTVADALAALETGGWLQRVSGGQQAGLAVQYRFVFKRHVAVVYESRSTVDKGSAKLADPPAKPADGSAKTADRTQEELKPVTSGDSLKLVVRPGLTPAQQIRANMRGEQAS